MYFTGALAFDFNETHVKIPYARFHNDQTMALGVLLASLQTYVLFRPTRSI